MRTKLRSRSNRRYLGAVEGHARYWGTVCADGTHDPADAARITGDSAAYFSLRARRQHNPQYAAEDRRRALLDDARRQQAYRDLILAASKASANRPGSRGSV